MMTSLREGTPSLSQKLFLVGIFFWLDNIFGRITFLGGNNFWLENNSWMETSFRLEKSFRLENNFGWRRKKCIGKKFRLKNKFGWKKFVVGKNLIGKMFWCEHFFGGKQIFGLEQICQDIFVYPPKKR